MLWLSSEEGLMDPELVALASTGAATVVALLTTDAWGQAKTGLGSLWRHVHPDEARSIESDLAEARSTLLAATAERSEQITRVVVGEWRDRILSLLAAEPWLADELRRVLQDDLGPALDRAAGSAISTGGMHAKASGHSRIYQAGRDQHINE
jgi:hypothetical protein